MWRHKSADKANQSDDYADDLVVHSLNYDPDLCYYRKYKLALIFVN